MTQQELNTIIQTGEGYKIEFKRSVNSDLSKEIVAFANSSGGRIFIGIDDNGSVPGVTVDNSLKSKIEMMARDCDPSISISLEVSNNVLIVHVPEGTNKPYRCTNGFYIRNGASSVKLTTEEIRDFFGAEGKIHFDEMPTSLISSDILDKQAFDNYIRLSGITPGVDTKELLFNLGVVDDNERMNNTGILFFAQRPSRYLPQSAVTCVAYKGNVKVDILDKKTFEQTIVENIDEAIAFVKRHINVSYEIKGKVRTEKLEIPEVVLREAIVNAAAHRDYLQKGATVMIEVFDDRIEISNPGGLPKGLKEEDFGKRTLARNPLIAALLNRAGYIEKLGTGVPRIKKCMADAELPPPEFYFDDFFVITLKRVVVSKTAASFDVSAEREKRLLYLLQQLKNANAIEVKKSAKKFKVTEKSIRNDLLLLEKKGWIKVAGTTSNRSYQLTPMAEKQVQDG
jgi:ATP-dependent DNA helicase RecG